MVEVGVEVRGGKNPDTQKVYANLNPDVQITVVDQNGAPLAPANVSLIDDSGVVKYQATSITGNVATISSVYPNPTHYYVKAEATGYVMQLQGSRYPEIWVYPDSKLVTETVGMRNTQGQAAFTMLKADGSPARTMSFRYGSGACLPFDENGQALINLDEGSYTYTLMNNPSAYWSDADCVGTVTFKVTRGQKTTTQIQLGQLNFYAQNSDGTPADQSMNVGIGTIGCSASGNMSLSRTINRPVIPGRVFATSSTTHHYYFYDDFDIAAGETKTYTYRPGLLQWTILDANGQPAKSDTYGEVHIAANGINYPKVAASLPAPMTIQAPAGTVIVTPAAWDSRFSENSVTFSRIINPTLSPFVENLLSGQTTTDTVRCGALILHLNFGGYGTHSFNLAMLDDSGNAVINSTFWTQMGSENIPLPFCAPGRYTFRLSRNGKTATNSIEITSGETKEMTLDVTK